EKQLAAANRPILRRISRRLRSPALPELRKLLQSNTCAASDASALYPKGSRSEHAAALAASPAVQTTARPILFQSPAAPFQNDAAPSLNRHSSHASANWRPAEPSVN